MEFPPLSTLGRKALWAGRREGPGWRERCPAAAGQAGRASGPVLLETGSGPAACSIFCWPGACPPCNWPRGGLDHSCHSVKVTVTFQGLVIVAKVLVSMGRGSWAHANEAGSWGSRDSRPWCRAGNVSLSRDSPPYLLCFGTSRTPDLWVVDA